MSEFDGFAADVALVEVDTAPSHPKIVFFQARRSKFTVAVDRLTGAIVGRSLEAYKGFPRLTEDEQAVLNAAIRYKKARKLRAVK